MGKDSEMSNEPVTWTVCLDCGKRVTADSIHTCSPQLKELTDEEIQEVAHGFGVIGWLGDITYEFARAILRKAQDK